MHKNIILMLQKDLKLHFLKLPTCLLSNSSKISKCVKNCHKDVLFSHGTNHIFYDKSYDIFVKPTLGIKLIIINSYINSILYSKQPVININFIQTF